VKVEGTSPLAGKGRQACAFAFFSLFWLVPVACNGLRGGRPTPGVPVRLIHLANVSCLFSFAMPSWPIHYMQVQLDPQGEWRTLPEADYFRMEAFGHRTRLTDMLSRGLGDRALQELALWIRRRYQELHPGGPAPVGFRMLSTLFRAGDPIPAGHWRTPPLDTVPADRREVWFEVRFEGPDAAALPDDTGAQRP
jgi:hypothetical protein